MKPEEKEKQLDIIRRQLGLSEAGEELVELFDGLLASALMHGNRTSTPDALLKLVRDAVCAAWRRRGDEGSTGSTAGGQSYTYEDIEATLHKNIVAAGLRVLRL